MNEASIPPGGPEHADHWPERIRALETSMDELRRELALLRARLEVVPEHPPAAEPVLDISAAMLSQPAAGAPGATAAHEERLREAFRAELSSSAPAKAPASGPLTHLRRSSVSASQVESLVGRYGMLALSTVAVLAGVGTFLKWAIDRGWLSPSVRVVIGLVVAAALAVAGLRLRRRERSFGSTLLGLALAIAHVCAWGSGPSLHLVPDAVAFAGVAIASVVLAAFAYREADEPLWCVGFGGAAIAPFVTSSGGGEATLLALYGVLVLLTGCWALRDRAWPIAERVLQGATAIFVAALASMPERQAGPLLGVAVPLVVAIAGALRSASTQLVRGRLRPFGVLAGLAAIRAGAQSAPVVSRLWLAMLLGAAGIVWLALVDHVATSPATVRSSERRHDADSIFDWLDAGWIPLLFVASVIIGLNDGRWGGTWTFAGAAMAFVAFVARRPAGALRDAAAFAAGASAIASLIVAWSETALLLDALLAVMAVMLLAAHLWRPSRSWLMLAGLALVASSVASLGQLGDRPQYAYLPFGTSETAVAFVVAASWVVFAFLARSSALALLALARDHGDAALREARARRFVTGIRMLGALFVFLWINVELAHAVSPTVALLLLITYYALTAVLSVWLGRRLAAPVLRRIGLALAFVAALVAFNGARGIDSVAARIAAYLVTAVFLLGIAYWYRRPGPLPEGSDVDHGIGAEPPHERVSTTA